MNIFGYYDSPQQGAPSFDPGLGVNCPFCLRPLEDEPERRTISFMAMGGTRSYFYRVHKTCHVAASPEDEVRIESWIIDKPLWSA